MILNNNQVSASDRLKLEALRRIYSGVLFQLIVNALLWLYFTQLNNLSPYFNFGLTLNSLLIGGRGVIYFKLKKSNEDLLRSFNFQMFLSMGNALAYGYLFYDSVMFYQFFTPVVLMLLFIVTGLMTAVIHSLGPTPFFQRTYIVLMSTPILIAFFTPSIQKIFPNFGVMFSIYSLYLLYSSRGVSKDITASYISENSALEKTQLLQKVINFIPGFVALTDTSGKWITASQSFTPLKKSKEILNLIGYYLQTTDYAPLTRELVWHENNEKFAYIVSIQRYQDHSLIIVGVPAQELVTIRDELDNQRSKAEYAARLATLGEMAGGIAHEINNPLAVIIGSCGQITRLIDDEENLKNKNLLNEKIDRISKTSFRINKIINGLRSFSRQADQDPFEPTSVQLLIDECLELCKERFYQNSIELEISQIPDIKVPMRLIQISQVIINLLNNAFDAVKNQNIKKVMVNFRASNEHLFILISDTGAGVPDDLKQKIFEPFFTTKEVGQGTGLGLSISRGILLDHQGELTLLPQEKYTTFQLKLPIKRSQLKTA